MSTIRDVAAYAKVSVSTVSHVVNGTRFVDPATAARVLLAIKALNYRTNSLARSLRRRETNTIGLVIPDNSNPFFADLARATEDAGFAEGYNVILCNSDNSEAKEATYVNVLLSKQVDGLILIASSNQLDTLETILSMQVPVVVADRELGDLQVDQVLVDNEQGGYLAGQYLLRLGHTRIGCIEGPGEVAFGQGRIMGFRRALAEVGCHLDPSVIVPGDFSYSGGESAMRVLLERNLGLTAIFAANDLMAIGAINILRRAGYRIPDDVSVMGFDNILHSEAMWPPVTTIAQPVSEIGRTIVALLLDQIRHVERPVARVMLPTFLIERESCRAIR